MNKYRCLLLLTALFISGCGVSIKEGEIVAKKHEPEQINVLVMPIIISNGKTCSTIMVPMFLYDDEDFIITIKGVNQSNKLQRRTLYVTKTIFDAVNIGDWFCLTDYPVSQINIRDSPIVKRRATKEEQKKYL